MANIFGNINNLSNIPVPKIGRSASTQINLMRQAIEERVQPGRNTINMNFNSTGNNSLTRSNNQTGGAPKIAAQMDYIAPKTNTSSPGLNQNVKAASPVQPSKVSYSSGR